MAPRVSIVVNVFNGERYLAECLDSILALEGASCCEIIVADDGSKDGTSEILHHYGDGRIVNARLERNVGAAAAISHAFDLVRGEFVARIDYDDRYKPNFLVESLAALERNPEAAFVCSGAMMIDSDGNATAPAVPGQYGEEPGCRDRFRSMLTRNFVTAPTILGRVSHWRRAIPIPKGMNFCDWYMNLTMAESAPVVVLDKITADYRVHPLGMHTTQVRDGMGERVTREVLHRFLEASPRRAEMALFARSIRARHAADWGDKYFGAGMDAEALRCYREAVRMEPTIVMSGGLLRRMLGLTAGRGAYDTAKRFVRVMVAARRSDQ